MTLDAEDRLIEEILTCVTCRGHKLARPHIMVVADHWVEAHYKHLNILQAALTLIQAMEMGLVVHG